jgi:putative Ca2+/H+ antiporter (TMEM165/GDT1 family)
MPHLSFDVTTALTAFVLILPVELPDKTFVVSLVLATRYRPLPVWLGVSAAFLVQCAVAVAAGGLLSLLPGRLVAAAAALLFAAGAVVLFRSAARADAEEAESEQEVAQRVSATGPTTGFRAAAISFGMLFAAEWGDLSQLLTAGLAARSEQPLSVFAGSWLALVTVAGIAVLAGRTLVRLVSLATIRRVGGTICAVLAVLSAVQAAGADLPL